MITHQVCDDNILRREPGNHAEVAERRHQQSGNKVPQKPAGKDHQLLWVSHYQMI